LHFPTQQKISRCPNRRRKPQAQKWSSKTCTKRPHRRKNAS